MKEYTINPIERAIGKDSKEFSRKDIITYITEHKIRQVNFRYVGGDGRLKELTFVIHDRDYLDEILTAGERVDGSSLFSFIGAGSSDLYVVPRYSTAFMDPFADEPTISFFCSYFDKDGNPLETSPEHILHKACRAFEQVTGGMRFHAMGELEFYVIGEADTSFPAVDQRGYHEAGPFSKFASFRKEAMQIISQLGCKIKYGHSEVGNFTVGDQIYEQNEIEFLPVDAEEAVRQLLLGKWVINSLAHQYGYTVTFAPKITVGKAGSGLHIHTKIVQNGCNMYIENGRLSDVAHKAIAGFLKMAGALTAFGNTNPTSYLRLVPNQEAPTIICWGDCNRSVLVRVPLGWTSDVNMSRIVNPIEEASNIDFSQKQTIEFRASDGSADLYLLVAGMVVAARYGFEMSDALQYARDNYVDVNVHKAENEACAARLDRLPASCSQSADRLMEVKDILCAHGVFTLAFIESLYSRLKAFDDEDIRQRIEKNPELLNEMVEKYLYI